MRLVSLNMGRYSSRRCLSNRFKSYDTDIVSVRAERGGNRD